VGVGAFRRGADDLGRSLVVALERPGEPEPLEEARNVEEPLGLGGIGREVLGKRHDEPDGP
jgi:hypothetical protein